MDPFLKSKIGDGKIGPQSAKWQGYLSGCQNSVQCKQ